MYYENTTGTLNVLMENNEPVIAALNLSLGKVITLSNDTNLKKLCNYVVDQVTSDLSEDEIDDLLSKLNNDWDGESDDCQAYSFNTTMFHPNVYYLQFQSF